jgi:hypothetical protein
MATGAPHFAIHGVTAIGGRFNGKKVVVRSYWRNDHNGGTSFTGGRADTTAAVGSVY